MKRNFTQAELKRIGRLVVSRNLVLYRIVISGHACGGEDAVDCAEYLLAMWDKISHNRSPKSFFGIFLGLIRDLLFDIDGEECTPQLRLICFADRKQLVKKRMDMREITFLSWMSWAKTTRAVPKHDTVAVELIPEEMIPDVLAELTSPCLRVTGNPPPAETERLLTEWAHNRQTSGRSGIVSRKNLERNVALERDR